MTSPFFTDEGKLRTLSLIKLTTTFGGLYKNSTLTPSDDTTYATLTQCAGSWYATQTLVWPTPNLNASDEGTMTATPITFAYTGSSASETVYGSFIGHGTGGDAVTLVIQALDSPKTMSATGDSITVTFKLRDDQG